MTYTCPSCGIALNPPPELLGQKVSCPSCNAEFFLPKDESVSDTKSEPAPIEAGTPAKRAKRAKKKSGKKKIERAATEKQLNLLAAKISISNQSYTRTQASKLIVENPQKPNWSLKNGQKLTILQALLKSQMGELKRLEKALQAEDLDDEFRSELEEERDDLIDEISSQEELIQEHKQDEKEELLQFQEAMTDDYECFHEIIKKPTLSQVKEVCAALDAQNPHWNSYREGRPDPNEVLCNALLTKFPSLRKSSATRGPSSPSAQSSSQPKKKGKYGCLLLFTAALSILGFFRILNPEEPQDESESTPAEKSEEAAKLAEKAATPDNPLLGIRAPMRTWQNKKGDQLEAELMRLFKIDGVYHGDFLRPNGKVFTYKIGNFSQADIDFVKELLGDQQ